MYILFAKIYPHDTSLLQHRSTHVSISLERCTILTITIYNMNQQSTKMEQTFTYNYRQCGPVLPGENVKTCYVF